MIDPYPVVDRRLHKSLAWAVSTLSVNCKGEGIEGKVRSVSSLVLEKCHVTPLQRIGDFHLMDRVLEYGQFRQREIRLINYCRLYLQVRTIADLTTAEGTLVDPGFLFDQVSLLSSRSTDLEIIQERPSTPEAWTAWRKAC
jgi:hypothetical protein